MKCPKCECEVIESEQFCRNCGFEFNSVEEEVIDEISASKMVPNGDIAVMESVLVNTQMIEQIIREDEVEGIIDENSEDITDELEDYSDDDKTRYIDGTELAEALEKYENSDVYHSLEEVHDGPMEVVDIKSYYQNSYNKYHKESSETSVSSIVIAIVIGLVIIAFIVIAYLKLKGIFI